MKKTLFTLLFLFLSLFVSSRARAQITGNTNNGITGNTEIIPNPLRVNSIMDLVNDVINKVLIPIGAVVAAMYIIYSGFLFVTAQGNETKISDAKRAFYSAVIGTAILLGSWAIAQGIKKTVDQIRGTSSFDNSQQAQIT
ncbi:TrbC/VirB2 family protein [Candidatus Parcubacteria bacterium]|nr:TrbC/VirB2 family protein [Candidatus Parcubacteria bacterium]